MTPTKVERLIGWGRDKQVFRVAAVRMVRFYERVFQGHVIQWRRLVADVWRRHNNGADSTPGI